MLITGYYNKAAGILIEGKDPSQNLILVYLKQDTGTTEEDHTVDNVTQKYITNVQLGLHIWDYSNMPGNLFGQICPQFTALWIVVAGAGIVIFDWLRYWLYNEQKPRYTWKF